MEGNQIFTGDKDPGPGLTAVIVDVAELLNALPKGLNQLWNALLEGFGTIVNNHIKYAIGYTCMSFIRANLPPELF